MFMTRVYAKKKNDQKNKSYGRSEYKFELRIRMHSGPHRRDIKRLCLGVYFNTFRSCITAEMKNIPLRFII